MRDRNMESDWKDDYDLSKYEGLMGLLEDAKSRAERSRNKTREIRSKRGWDPTERPQGEVDGIATVIGLVKHYWNNGEHKF